MPHGKEHFVDYYGGTEEWDAAAAFIPKLNDKLPPANVGTTSPTVTGQKRKRLSSRTYVVPSGFAKIIDRYIILIICVVSAEYLKELTCAHDMYTVLSRK